MRLRAIESPDRSGSTRFAAFSLGILFRHARPGSTEDSMRSRLRPTLAGTVAPTLAAALILGGVLTLVAAGCSQKLRSVVGAPNQPPRVELSAHLFSSASGTNAYDLTWRASDPDGRVDHYLVTTDPRAIADERGAWARSGETGRILQLRRGSSIGPEDAVSRREPEVFAVRAVDDGGALSDP